MANQDAAFGLRPLTRNDGGSLDNLVVPGYIPAADATAFFIGSPVKLTGTSNTAAVTGFVGGDYEIGQLPTVDESGATGFIDYVIVGFAPTCDDGMGTADGAASTERVPLLMPTNNVVFEIQSDNTGASAAADVGSCADTIAESGNATTGISTVELGDASLTTNTAQLKIIGVSYDLNNSDISSANVNWRVVVNESIWLQGSAGI